MVGPPAGGIRPWPAAEAGDASVVAAVFTDDSGGYWLHGIRYLRVDAARPGEDGRGDAALPPGDRASLREQRSAGDHHRDQRHRPLSARACCAASCDAQGSGMAVIEQVSTTRKDQRILDAFDPLLAAGALRAHASVWDTPFIREMREWLPGGRGARRRPGRGQRLHPGPAGPPGRARHPRRPAATGAMARQPSAPIPASSPHRARDLAAQPGMLSTEPPSVDGWPSGRWQRS